MTLTWPESTLAKPERNQREKVRASVDQRAAKDLGYRRSSKALPSSSKLETPTAKTRDTRLVKPPRSKDFYGEQGKEAEYERLLDEEIKKLFQLTQQYKRSRSRGEIWLRLGEAYVEKAQLIEFREQAEFERKMADFMAKKTRVKPKANLKLVREYNRKAIQLYEWFLRDFPKDRKIDQALFFLGYSHFESGDVKKGEQYYQRLVREFPNSAFVTESHFALGEFYFENDQWQKALDNYTRVIQQKKVRLNTFAMYKAAWCLYRLNRTKSALKMLERVVSASRADQSGSNPTEGRRSVNRVRLAAEALRDYVPFYAESGDFRDARREFSRLAQDESLTFKMLERLAYIYADAGNRMAANAVFKDLIGQNPTGERASDYQYQVILAFATADQRRFREELVVWLENFGPESAWAKANSKNQKLVEDVAKLQELTLRNHVLQLHQTAQNSKAQFSQQQANSGYQLYMKYFSEGANAAEMLFFQAELLFDMNRFQDAARVYLRSAERDAKGKYAEEAITNAVLAYEKDLPTPQQIEEKRGKSIEKMPLDAEVVRFERAAQRYFETFPKGKQTIDIKRRLGVLYYSYNHFDRAMELFEDVIKSDPKSQNAEIAGNLLLDIYKLRGDIVGLAERGNQLISDPRIANTKFGAEVKTILLNANFVRAQKLSESGDNLASAKEFERFANDFKTSELSLAARYNAAVNFEKAGDVQSALKLHGMVLLAPANDEKSKKLQVDSRNASARLYQQTGQLDLAAKQYELYAQSNPKDQKAINAYFNAAVIWDGLRVDEAAIRNYRAYFSNSTRADRVESLFFEAEVERRRGGLSRAIALYEQYLSSGGKNGLHLIQSHYHVATLSRRLGQATKSKEALLKTVAVYQSQKKQGQDFGVEYAAEARFLLAQATLEDLKKIRFTSSDKQQAQAAAQIKSLRERYIAEMKEVIRFDYGPMIVAALASSGQMFDHIAETFSKIPVPAGFTPEDGAKYKELIDQEIESVRKEAKTSYKAAWDKAIEFEAYGEWSKLAARGLARYEPKVPTSSDILRTVLSEDWMGL